MPKSVLDWGYVANGFFETLHFKQKAAVFNRIFFLQVSHIAIAACLQPARHPQESRIMNRPLTESRSRRALHV